VAAPVKPSCSPDQLPPTLDQLLILVARAERKGGLNYVEGSRLREGLRYLAGQNPSSVTQDAHTEAMSRRYETARKKAWLWKGRALAAGYGASVAPVREPDEEARAALLRVVDLATRWTHIPARRQAGASVLSVVSNRDRP
jgi:hypothetical protein